MKALVERGSAGLSHDICVQNGDSELIKFLGDFSLKCENYSLLETSIAFRIVPVVVYIKATVCVQSFLAIVNS